MTVSFYIKTYNVARGFMQVLVCAIVCIVVSFCTTGRTLSADAPGGVGSPSSGGGGAAGAIFYGAIGAVSAANHLINQPDEKNEYCSQLYRDLKNNRVSEQRWNEYYAKCQKLYP